MTEFSKLHQEILKSAKTYYEDAKEMILTPTEVLYVNGVCRTDTHERSRGYLAMYNSLLDQVSEQSGCELWECIQFMGEQ